ncbi:MAG: nitrogen regulation protein NR(II) [Phycisphaerales bacterium]
MNEPRSRLFDREELEREIEARRRTEAALARVAAIVESSDDAIVGLSLDGVITSWNAGAEGLYGYSPDEIVGRPITALVPDDYLDEIESMLERMRRGERIKHIETTRVARDGRRLEISLSMSPVRDATGELVGVSSIARDITQGKRTAAALERAVADLRRRNEEIREFLSIIAHDLKHPLVSLRGLLQLIEEDAGETLDEESREYLDLALDECSRMAEMLGQFSELARIQQSTPRTERASVYEVVKRCADRFAAPARGRKIRVVTRTLDQEAVFARAFVEEALTNLIDNAVKYGCGEEGATIEIDAEIRGGELIVSVRDFGPGIPQDRHATVFHPFRRLVSDDEVPGSGLGLAATRRLIEVTGGRIELDSDVGRGACFTLYTPIRD